MKCSSLSHPKKKEGKLLSKQKKDLNYEGKEHAYLDIDRMINEGMSGGHVIHRENATNIEEARDITKEEPPHHL